MRKLLLAILLMPLACFAAPFLSADAPANSVGFILVYNGAAPVSIPGTVDATGRHLKYDLNTSAIGNYTGTLAADYGPVTCAGTPTVCTGGVSSTVPFAFSVIGPAVPTSVKVIAP